MRWLALLICVSGVASAQPPWKTHLAARKAAATHVHAPPAVDGRHKPDDVGVYDLEQVSIAFTVPEVGLPMALSFSVTLAAQVDLEAIVPLLLLHSRAVAVTLDEGQELPFEQIRDTGELLVELPEPLLTGQRISMRIEAVLDYACSGGPNCSEAGAYLHLADAGWYPMSLEHPAGDRFDVRLDLESDAGRFPSSIGGLAIDETPEGTRRWRYQSETPVSALAVAFSSDPPRIVDADPIQLFGPDPDPSLSVLLESLVQSYEGLLGPYPYSRIAMTAIPDAARAAIGPQANLFVPLSIWRRPETDADRDFQREIVSHEFAHQYFFNLVGITDPTEAWLSEGFAEFTSTLFSNRVTGRSDHRWRNYWGYLTTVTEEDDAPLYGLEVRQGPHFFEITYLKGSAVLWMLRETLGDVVFDAALSDYVAAFSGQIATTPEFIDHMASQAQTDLGAFFDRWVYRGGHPRLVAQTTRRGVSREEVNFSLRDETVPPFEGQVPVILHDLDEQRLIQVDIGSETRVRLGEDGWIEVDPERTWLRRIRAQSTGDVNLDGAIDGKDLLDLHAALGREIPGATWHDTLDVVRDGRIDDADLRAVMERYGEAD